MRGLANFLNKRRKALGMTRQHLACHAGITIYELRGILEGRPGVPLYNVLRVAHSMGLIIKLTRKS